MGRPLLSEKNQLGSNDEDDESVVINLSSERVIFLSGDIDEHPIANVTASLFSLLKKDHRKPIKLIISTYGGSIYEMFGLYDAIKYVQSIGCPVYTIALGKVMSAGVLLLACGNKGFRSIGENTSVMYHLGSDEMGGDLFELKNSIKEFERIEELAIKLLSENSNMSIEDINSMLKDRQDIFLTSDEVIKLGIADYILGKK